jgi:hypothetical protein
MLGRSLLIKASGARLLYPGYVQDYLDRVTAADVGAGNTLGLERGVTDAFSTCLQNMVSDTSLGVSGGVLAQAASLVKASCFMQGARTLPGSLVPLADDMPKPTNFNFVAGDYNRRTGSLSNGSTKFLGSNRAGNADLQNSQHLSTYITASGTGFTLASGVAAGRSSVAQNATRSRNSSASTAGGTANVNTFTGLSRSSSAEYVRRVNGTNTLIVQPSETPPAFDYFVFACNDNGSAVSLGNHRLAFYSIGSALDLAILDARITALANAIQAAIAP